MNLSSYDVIIAGGGLAGLLAAQRICNLQPSLRVVIIEKEPHLGGRAVTRGTISGNSTDKYGYGLHGVSPRLYEFWNQALKSDPEADDLPSLMDTRLTKAAILMGSKLTPLETTDLCNEKGARALGGLAAERQWPDVKKILDSEDRFDSTFADKWKAPRKSPAILVLETYAQSFGITNIWESTPGAIAERASALTCPMYAGNWGSSVDALLRPLTSSRQLTIQVNARIIDATFAKSDDQKGTWEIETAQGTFSAPSLVVAQPPWTASQWLPKNLWPASLATVVSKTKPVSTVVLSCPVTSGDTSGLPQLIFIPAEGVQATVTDCEIVFQATIDYEMSVVAPDVVKAVKRLKRAHRKLLAAAPLIKTGVEHVALVPVSWGQTPLNSERRHLDKLKMKSVQEKQLSFCGDAYGQSLDGDVNIVESVLSTSEAILS